LPQRPASVKLICAFSRFGVVLKWSFCGNSLFESTWKNCIALLPYCPINSSNTCFALSLFASVTLE